MTPREIVSELDRYIVGQKDAKRAVAIALRNRWRRQLVPEDLREEIAPKNIIMIGPTGVGKTEISRRLPSWRRRRSSKSKPPNSPKSATSAATSSRSSAILTDLAVNMVKEEEKQKVEIKAHEVAEERVLGFALAGRGRVRADGEAIDSARLQGTREKLKKMLREGKMDDRFVDIEMTQSAMPMIEVLTPQGMEGMEFNLERNVFQPDAEENQKEDRQNSRSAGNSHPGRSEQAGRYGQSDRRSGAPGRAVRNCFSRRDRQDRRARIDARVPMFRAKACSAICCRSSKVRRSTPNTAWSRPIIFCLSLRARFISAKPSDLIPEFQGRFPIRVELSSLSKEDFVRILDRTQECADQTV